MPNNNSKTIKKSAEPQLVILLKLLIVFVILLIPLSFMLIDISNNLLNIQKTNQQANKNVKQEDNEDFNFQASLPPEKIGDISDVSQEKKDSLFNNLKK